jgi:hypothetical protein
MKFPSFAPDPTEDVSAEILPAASFASAAQPMVTADKIATAPNTRIIDFFIKLPLVGLGSKFTKG